MARVVEVEESGMRVERRPEGLHLTLQRHHPWWHYLFPLWFLVIFGWGLVSMLTADSPEEGGGWFVVPWVLVGVVAMSSAVWGLFHREELLVDAQHLTHTRRLGPIRRARAYVRERIEDVRVSQPASPFSMRGSFNALGAPIVAFDYGSRTVRIADVEEAEAKRLVAALAAEGVA